MSLEVFRGRWKQQDTIPEGFDAFMDTAGIPESQRDQMRKMRSIMEISGEGDNRVFEITVEGFPGSKKYEFKMGEPFEGVDFFGRKFESIIKADGDNKLLETYTKWSDSAITTVREVNGNVMNCVTTCNNAVLTVKMFKI